MRDILDLANRWTGTFGGAIVPGNKAPIAIDDDLSVELGSGPVSISVLSNDIDPESQTLTLVSAFAALGTAVAEANNTVTYTPPPGISGFDTVVYEIADDLDQRDTGQINVTITAPMVAILTQPDNTLVVDALDGAIDLTVSDPANFAGTTAFDTAELSTGPVNLSIPTLTGTPLVNALLSASAGLWAYDGASGTPVRSWQWRRDGADIASATNPTYTVQAADDGRTISVVETQTDSGGARSAESASVTVAGASFSPGDDPLLMSWYDAADAATLTGGASVSAWADKAGSATLTQSSGTRQPSNGTRSVNGLNALDFTADDWMSAAFSVPASGNLALHMAGELDSVNNAFAALLALDAASNDMQLDALTTTQFDGRLNLAGVGPSVDLSGGPFSGPFVLSIVFDRTGTGTAEVFVGDVSRGSTTYTTSLDSAAALHLMTNRSKNAGIDGAVCELVLTEDVTNRASHHSYLAQKWGIA
ncbi:MAG: Ig-like domain-containing protein [Pseudomonadota bacterium]